MSRVNRVIGVVSGKGGVGKSLVTSLLACAVQQAGKQTAILDADITGPSIPRMFGAQEPALGNDEGLLFPAQSQSGVRLMSINLLLDEETAPGIWRGPGIAGFQSLLVDAIVVVTTPQSLVSMIVEKAVNMASMMQVPVLGVVENMSYAKCPDCGKELYVFGESHVADIAAKHGIPLLGRLPIDPSIADACDKGNVHQVSTKELQPAVDAILAL